MVARSPVMKAGSILGTTLFDRVSPQMTIYKDEIFGPVLLVLRVEPWMPRSSR